MKLLANGLQIEVDDTGGEGRPVVLLIMGLGMQLVAWPTAFVRQLADAGFRVIRHDNRDIGLSQGFDHAGTGNIVWESIRQRLGLQVRSAYTLQDMARDSLGVLDALGIKQAHVIGASMGGMIAQRLAIDYPDRARSLCSIMSTTGSLLVGHPQPGVIEALLKPLPSDRDAAIEHIVGLYNLIGSKTHAAAEAGRRRALAEAAYDRSVGPTGAPLHPGGGARQVGAILLAGDRTKALKTLTLPALVVHGNEDALINVSGGRATRDAIPGAQWLGGPQNGVEGMGHDLPHPLLDTIVDGIVAHLKNASTLAWNPGVAERANGGTRPTAPRPS